MSTATAARYHHQLERLADRNRLALRRLWDRSRPWDVPASLAFHAAAAPAAEATARAAIDLTAAYASTTSVNPGPVPDLFVRDAGARAFEPFDRLRARMLAGDDWVTALASARSVAEAVGVDSAIVPARTAAHYALPGVTEWLRRLDPGACEWCMSFAAVTFSAAAEADFGHLNCKCVPMPVAEVGDHNDRIRSAAGFDAAAERRWNERKHRRRLEDSVATAERHSREAAAELATETDPTRRDRLSIREQEWETRAEAAAERLRILTTGTHRLAS